MLTEILELSSFLGEEGQRKHTALFPGSEKSVWCFLSLKVSCLEKHHNVKGRGEGRDFPLIPLHYMGISQDTQDIPDILQLIKFSPNC